jgi:hypothetical protein
MALGTRYRVDAEAIEEVVERALSLSPQACAALGEAARTFFLDNDAAFPHRLALALQPSLDAGTPVPRRGLARLATALLPHHGPG